MSISAIPAPAIKPAPVSTNEEIMSVQVIPAGASAVVSEDNRHHDRHEGSRHPNRWDLSTEMQRDLIFSRTQAEKEFIELTNQAERNQAASVVQGSLTQQEMGSGFAAALVDSAKNAAAISVQSQSETNQLSNQATNNANLTSVQATNNFNLSSIQAQTLATAADISRQKFAYESQLQAQTLASSADVSRQKFAYEGQLQAQTFAAAAAAQAAECCCELKEKIGSDGQKTRDLINEIQMQNVRDSRTKLEIAYAALYSSKTPPVAPTVG